MRSTFPIAIPVAVLLATARAGAATNAECVDAYEKAQYAKKETKLLAAREALLVCAQDDCPAATRTDCVPWLAEVEKAIPTIVVAVRDQAGNDVLDAKLTLDGAPQDVASGKAISLDPGTTSLHVEAPDGRSADLSILARAGEKNRLVTLTLPGGVPVGAARTPSPEAPATPPDARGGRSLVLPIGLTAIGLAGIGASVLFGVTAKQDADDLRATCAPRCPDSDIDAVESKLLLSDIALGVGVVAIGAAAVLWLAPSSSSKAQAPSPAPTMAPRRGGLVFRF